MLNETWPAAIKQALFDARIDEAILLADSWTEEVATFVERWGRLDVDNCKRALAEGNAYERLFALFILGTLVPNEMETILLPFLHSQVRKERWASAILMGRYTYEQAFPLLLKCLTEELVYPPFASSDHNVMLESAETVHHVSEYPEETEWYAHNEWYSLHRPEIALLLGSYGNPQAISELTHTFEIGLKLEFSESGWVSDDWYRLEDCLAYALGELRAWQALDQLALPPKRLLIARIYMALGSLKANRLVLFSLPHVALLSRSVELSGPLEEMKMQVGIPPARSSAEQEALDELPSLALPVCQIVKEQWHFRQDECHMAFHNFFLWYAERYVGPLP